MKCLLLGKYLKIKTNRFYLFLCSFEFLRTALISLSPGLYAKKIFLLNERNRCNRWNIGKWRYSSRQSVFVNRERDNDSIFVKVLYSMKRCRESIFLRTEHGVGLLFSVDFPTVSRGTASHAGGKSWGRHMNWKKGLMRAAVERPSCDARDDSMEPSVGGRPSLDDVLVAQRSPNTPSHLQSRQFEKKNKSGRNESLPRLDPSGRPDRWDLFRWSLFHVRSVRPERFRCIQRNPIGLWILHRQWRSCVRSATRHTWPIADSALFYMKGSRKRLSGSNSPSLRKSPSMEVTNGKLSHANRSSSRGVEPRVCVFFYIFALSLSLSLSLSLPLLFFIFRFRVFRGWRQTRLFSGPGRHVTSTLLARLCDESMAIAYFFSPTDKSRSWFYCEQSASSDVWIPPVVLRYREISPVHLSSLR